MTAALNFVRTFPSLSISVIVGIISIPFILDLIDFIHRLQIAIAH